MAAIGVVLGCSPRVSTSVASANGANFPSATVAELSAASGGDLPHRDGVVLELEAGVPGWFWEGWDYALPLDVDEATVYDPNSGIQHLHRTGVLALATDRCPPFSRYNGGEVPDRSIDVLLREMENGAPARRAVIGWVGRIPVTSGLVDTAESPSRDPQGREDFRTPSGHYIVSTRLSANASARRWVWNIAVYATKAREPVWAFSWSSDISFGEDARTQLSSPVLDAIEDDRGGLPVLVMLDLSLALPERTTMETAKIQRPFDRVCDWLPQEGTVYITGDAQ